jgi:hypothetical protein
MKTLCGRRDKASWGQREGTHRAQATRTVVIAAAEGSPPGMRTSEGIWIQFY